MTASVDSLRARLHAGAPLPRDPAVEPRVARAVALAGRLGAPALPALRAALEAEDEATSRDDALQAATAQARTVTAALLGLPLVALPVIAGAADVAVLDFYRSPAGRRTGVIVLMLLGAGALVARGLIGAAARGPRRGIAEPADLDEVADLVATALTAGLPPGAAARAVADALPHHASALRRLALALERGAADAVAGGMQPVADVLDTARVWGSPAAPALRGLAGDIRARRLAGARVAAQRLPARLTFPTALCVLPATVLAIGAPLLASGLAAAGT